MAPASLELTIMAAENLKNTSLLRLKMDPYAVAFVDPSSKRSTRVLRRAGSDPVWNDTLLIPVDDRFLSEPFASLTIQIFNQGAINTSLIGATQLLLHDLFRHKLLKGNDDADILTLQLFRPSGRPHGVVRVFLKVVADNLSCFSGLLEDVPEVPATGIPVMSMSMQNYSPGDAKKYSYPYSASYVQPGYLPYPTPPPQCPRRNNNFIFGLVSGAVAAVLLGALF